MTRTFRPVRPFRSLLAGLALLALASHAPAQTTPVPTMMNFQGRLAKPDGTPVADGSNYQITFRIFGMATGGTALWTQTMNNVSVRNGVFSVLLGSGNALTDTVLNGTPYLEIQIGSSTPLSPRQAFTSVAFAVKANTVPDGAITSAKLSSSFLTAGGDLTGTYPNPLLAAKSSSFAKVSGGAATSDGTNLSTLGTIRLNQNGGLGDVLRIGNGTAVGLSTEVGYQYPIFNLDLNFRGSSVNNAIVGGAVRLDGRSPAVPLIQFLTRQAGTGSTSEHTAMCITETGNVGINDSDPTAPLHVLGRVYIDGGLNQVPNAPLVTLAIGDTDTGLNWTGDGKLDVYANGANMVQVRAGSVNV